MHRNAKLKLKIFEQGKRQRQVARRAGIHESTLSSIIGGRYPASRKTKQNLAKVLGVKVAEIFPDTAHVTSKEDVS